MQFDNSFFNFSSILLNNPSSQFSLFGPNPFPTQNMEDRLSKIQQVATELASKENDERTLKGQVSVSKKRRIETVTMEKEIPTFVTSKKRKKLEDQKVEDKQSSDIFSEEVNPSLFFSFQEPNEWFPWRRNEKGTIEIFLPKRLKEVKRLIYIFRNREKNCFLIGKTGNSLNTRMSSYSTLFNEKGSENRATQKGRRSFLVDIKNNPEHFDVAILHILEPSDDLDFFETSFIQHKKLHYQLYNDNNGGGGGSSHIEEEPVIYALVKPKIAPLTPPKYYPFRRENGRIRLQLTPNFKKRMRALREGLAEGQEIAYAYLIKRMDTKKYYAGISVDPQRRLKEHGYLAEYYLPDSKKYDPERKTGFLHRAMAEEPEQFGAALLTLQSIHQIDPDQLENYVLLEGIANVERYIIQHKQALISQQGFNGNRGGGGPIGRRVTKTARILEF